MTDDAMRAIEFLERTRSHICFLFVEKFVDKSKTIFLTNKTDFPLIEIHVEFVIRFVYLKSIIIFLITPEFAYNIITGKAVSRNNF